MRSRWLLVIAIASLCLNVAVVGTFLLHRVRRVGRHRVADNVLAPEVRERLRQARRASLPGFAALAESVESTDSLLWVEMKSESPDSARVESLCQALGRIHGNMRASVFRQMHRELQLMPVPARAEYLQHMMRMRPGVGFRHGMGRHMGRGPQMPPDDGPLPGEPPPGPPPEAGD